MSVEHYRYGRKLGRWEVRARNLYWRALGAYREAVSAILRLWRGRDRACLYPGCTDRYVALESSRTQYHWDGTGEDPNRDRPLCTDHADEHHANWDEQWAEYNAMIADNVRGAYDNHNDEWLDDSPIYVDANGLDYWDETR